VIHPHSSTAALVGQLLVCVQPEGVQVQTLCEEAYALVDGCFASAVLQLAAGPAVLGMVKICLQVCTDDMQARFQAVETCVCVSVSTADIPAGSCPPGAKHMAGLYQCPG